MGDPKKLRKKYKTPSHPWERERIDKEREITNNYGLKNKKEIWKFVSKLKRFTRQAKKLLGKRNEQSHKEEKDLIEKLKKYNLADENTKIEDVLNLGVEDLLERRLQTKVHRMGLARSVKQARQLIVHGHIKVSGKKTTIPSYLVKENDKVEYVEKSSFSNPEHPERSIKQEQPVQEVKANE